MTISLQEELRLLDVGLSDVVKAVLMAEDMINPNGVGDLPAWLEAILVETKWGAVNETLRDSVMAMALWPDASKGQGTEPAERGGDSV